MGRARKQAAGDPAVAVAYLRVSTADQHHGLDAQRASVERWAAEQGVQVVAWQTDVVSGSVAPAQREGFQRALEAIEQHGAGILVVARRDRLGRAVVPVALGERLAERAGAHVVSTDGGGNGHTPEAALMRTIVDAMAEYERELIRDRTRRALAARRASGKKTGGDVPYGYRLCSSGSAGELEEEPLEQAAMAVARDLRAAGHSLRVVGQRLSALGHFPRSGGSWHPQTVSALVRTGHAV